MPEIRLAKRGEGDVGLLLATDGFWDEIKVDKLKELAGDINQSNPHSCLSVIYLSRLMTRGLFLRTEELTLPRGSERRRKHDDTTMIYLNLD